MYMYSTTLLAEIGIAQSFSDILAVYGLTSVTRPYES